MSGYKGEGSGAPSSSNVGNAQVGDLFLRTDTPNTANQRVYFNTSAGNPGTFTGVA